MWKYAGICHNKRRTKIRRREKNFIRRIYLKMIIHTAKPASGRQLNLSTWRPEELEPLLELNKLFNKNISCK